MIFVGFCLNELNPRPLLFAEEKGSEGMSSQMFLQLHQHSLKILFKILVLESYHAHPQVIDDCCSQRVSFFLVVMNSPVNLHDELCVCAIEIREEECLLPLVVNEDGVLPKELLTEKLPVADSFPEEPLTFRLPATQVSCAVFATTINSGAPVRLIVPLAFRNQPPSRVMSSNNHGHFHYLAEGLKTIQPFTTPLGSRSKRSNIETPKL